MFTRVFDQQSIHHPAPASHPSCRSCHHTATASARYFCHLRHKHHSTATTLRTGQRWTAIHRLVCKLTDDQRDARSIPIRENSTRRADSGNLYLSPGIDCSSSCLSVHFSSYHHCNLDTTQSPRRTASLPMNSTSLSAWCRTPHRTASCEKVSVRTICSRLCRHSHKTARRFKQLGNESWVSFACSSRPKATFVYPVKRVSLPPWHPR